MRHRRARVHTPGLIRAVIWASREMNWTVRYFRICTGGRSHGEGTVYEAAEARAAVDAAYCFELMRAFLRAELRRSGDRATARQLRVRRSTLHRFLVGGDPGPKLWAAATDLALDRPIPPLAPEAIAIGLLAETFPPSRRPEMRQAFSEALRPLLEREGRAIPL